MNDNLNFYKNILKSQLPLTELLKDPKLFSSVPKNWSVVVTDIENSTNAVAKGLHNNVNLCATGSIITVLNTLKTVDGKIKIPYFFGGDGSTFIVPNTVLKPIMIALNNYSLHIKKTLELNLRVGQLEVEKIYNNNIALKITKVRLNKFLTTPAILGNGLKYAENTIKDSFQNTETFAEENTTLNLEGMECRWDEIYPNKSNKKVICLLVDCKDENKQAQVYSLIMKAIDDTFGNLENRNPISTLKLKLNISLEKIKKEMLFKLGAYSKTYLITNWILTIVGKYYFKFFKSGKLYKQKVAQLSDTIMLDGFLNTVISGTNEQVDKLKSVLDNLEKDNKIIYGIHITHASIMSCYVEDREDRHIHFVDGTEGGYTSAAIIFKEKLKKLSLKQL